MSRYRSLMCGLRPGGPAGPLALSDIDHESRLMRAAKPVVDELADELRDSMLRSCPSRTQSYLMAE
jgi:hypothetical protein